MKTVVIGAGPAGLTAAYQLAKSGAAVEVFESDDIVGGISRTVERDGWRFDIGGHRFFTKVSAVDALWHEILPDEDFLLRPRMSRIYYDGKLFDYPLKAMNALSNVGPVEAVACVGSYVWARIAPPKDQSNFEGWVSSRFGKRLYRMFFKTYTEKLWGIPATTIQADWAAQRIKNLSLFNAVVNAVMPKRNQKDITSLIEEFYYPKFGPGMMWERCTEHVRRMGGTVELEAPVVNVHREAGKAVAISVGGANARRVDGDHFISSMPISDLVKAMDPPAPAEVVKAADGLLYRDFLTIALVVPEEFSIPDNWIYIHDPGVKVMRIQNYGSWSPYLIKEGRTCLGLEFTVLEGDEMWTMDDDLLIKLGISELEQLKLVRPGAVERGFVVRMPKGYPVYDPGYHANLKVLREWLAKEVPNVYPVGRNGMHRYNNADHSMLTAMLTAENILTGSNHDVWNVNVEEEYHEESSSKDTVPPGASAPGSVVGGRSGVTGTGRDAPVLPGNGTTGSK